MIWQLTKRISIEKVTTEICTVKQRYFWKICQMLMFEICVIIRIVLSFSVHFGIFVFDELCMCFCLCGT